MLAIRDLPVNATFWAAVAALGSLASAGIAAWYTRLTLRLLRSQSEPNVVIYVRHDDSRASLLQIVVENIGHGLATDLRFNPSRPIPWGTRPGQSITGPFESGIPSLAPGGSRKVGWGRYIDLRPLLGTEPIVLICEYKHGKREMSVTTLLEVESFAGTDTVSSEGARIVHELEGICKTLAQVQAEFRAHFQHTNEASATERTPARRRQPIAALAVTIAAVVISQWISAMEERLSNCAPEARVSAASSSKRRT